MVLIHVSAHIQEAITRVIKHQRKNECVNRIMLFYIIRRYS